MPVSSLTGPLKRVCKLIFFSGFVKEPLVTAQIWKQFSNNGRVSHKGKERPWPLKGRFIGKPLRGPSGHGRCGKFKAAQILFEARVMGILSGTFREVNIIQCVFLGYANRKTNFSRSQTDL